MAEITVVREEPRPTPPPPIKYINLQLTEEEFKVLKKFSGYIGGGGGKGHEIYYSPCDSAKIKGHEADVLRAVIDQIYYKSL